MTFNHPCNTIGSKQETNLTKLNIKRKYQTILSVSFSICYMRSYVQFRGFSYLTGSTVPTLTSQFDFKDHMIAHCLSCNMLWCSSNSCEIWWPWPLTYTGIKMSPWFEFCTVGLHVGLAGKMFSRINDFLIQSSRPHIYCISAGPKYWNKIK